MIKLADFGLSRRIVEVSSNSNDIFGLLPYIDPQLFNDRTEDHNKKYKVNKKSDLGDCNQYGIGIKKKK
jgi:hypothetical protein